MSQPIEHAQDDRVIAVGRVEIVISTLLRVGVISSLAIIFIGMVISYAHHTDAARDPKQLAAITGTSASFPHSLRTVFSGVLALRGQAIVALGLLILIATPVMRVAISIVAFAVQRDRTYVIITCIVLTLLVLSFVLGHAGG